MTKHNGYKIPRYSDSNRGVSFRRLWKMVSGSSLALLIGLNVALFFVLGLIGLLGGLNVATFFYLRGGFDFWLQAPWGLLTYMFVQSDFLHLLFNMLWLWAFGSLMKRLGEERLLSGTYLVGGLAGGLCFVIVAQLTGISPAFLTGSSASVLGVIVASAVRHPRLELNLMLIGNVQLRWVALVAFLLCGLAPGLGNAPTLSAHIAGALAGGAYVLLAQPSRYALTLKNSPHKGQYNVRQQERRGLTPSEQAELDDLLDNVRRSGYKSLSRKQQARLFELSNRISNQRQ